jgi:hypothetical protein
LFDCGISARIKPSHDSSSASEDLDHHRDLRCLFIVVGLVDARGVSPEESISVGTAQISQGAVKVPRDKNLRAIVDM